MTTGLAWIARVEFERNDLRFGIAWYQAVDGLHFLLCFGVRLHLIRTRLRELSPDVHKLTLPPPPKPPGKLEAKSINLRWRR